MKVSSIIVSSVALAGFVAAKKNKSNSTSKNAAVALGGANNAVNAGIVGVAAAGAMAFLL